MFNFKSAKALTMKRMLERVAKAETYLDKEIQSRAERGEESLKVPVNYKGLNIREFNILLEHYASNGYYFTSTVTSTPEPNYVTISWAEKDPYKLDLKSPTRLSIAVTDQKIVSYSRR